MDAIDLYTNKNKILIKYLDDFVNQYEGEDIRPIKALRDKIEHMCFNIGSPVSVKPMLLSISTRKIKKWSTNSDDRGKQLTGTPAWQIDKYYLSNRKDTQSKLDICIGHFRWDWGAYMISRDDADYIMKYFFQKERKGNIYLKEILT